MLIQRKKIVAERKFLILMIEVKGLTYLPLKTAIKR